MSHFLLFTGNTLIGGNLMTDKNKDTPSVLDKQHNHLVWITRAIMDDESLRASDKSVYAALCMYADNRTAECWPSRETLMIKAGVSDKTLRRSLKNLQDKKYINIVGRFSKDGRRLSNVYVL